ncbi:uncharacterized protein LOC115230301 [Octopus sinensis]|uniref:Uncharacterized protein LOC115230301 n=1 Tax=Octopus sinensis TaxID=2607531 RepID=A0A6P7TVI4_9MOLL|nr:uncharacterized protein LOC115230301 [Octopus sinensis]
MSVFTSPQTNPEGLPTQNTNNNNQSEVGNVSSGIHGTPETCNDPYIEPSRTHLLPLKSLITETHSNDKLQWISSVVDSAKRRFGRIPRGGWNLIVHNFNTRFLVQKSISDVKKLLKVKPHSETCGNQNDVGVTENGNSLSKTEISLYGKCKEEFNFQIKRVVSISRDSRKPTKKIPYKLVKKDILVALDAVISNYVLTCPPKDINEITDIIFAGQCAYENLVLKNKIRTSWRENIEKRITKFKENLTLIANFSSLKSKSEKDTALDFMCSFGYKKSRKGETTRICTLIEDRIKIMEKRISIYESRKSFRRDNFCFELNRRRFYRNLNGGEDNKYTLPEGECLSFWEKIWKKDENHIVTDVVGKRITGIEQSPVDIKPDFIKSIINYAPNWKTSGCDGVYCFLLRSLNLSIIIYVMKF